MAKSPAPAIPPAARVVILHGPERYLITQHTDDLRDALQKTHGDIEVFTFDGASARCADILDELRSMGLMMRYKLVVVDNADLLLKGDDDAPATSRSRGVEKSPRDLIESYAASPEQAATLVLRANKWYPGKLDKAVLAAGGTVLKCDEMSDAGAAAWAVKRAAAFAVSLTPEVADILIEHLGPDLGRINSELSKLAIPAAATPAKAITAELVASLVGVSRQEDAWTMQAALLSGRTAEALNALKERLEVSRLNPVLIGLTYIDLARKLAGASAGLAVGKREQELSAELKLWGSAQTAILSAARRLPPYITADLLRAAVDVDVKQKTGGGEPQYLLEALTLKFTRALKTG